ncbi:MAG: hypothetical protein DI563_03205 [Variovorax paradoxus]|uniref:Uncharacterized protein n=1 Tax=Variovorax paradoxus TaxID=34073 RepID=A0A2W5QKQ6_VARPD|nr:MAG: hypothetical protein DI563_03205 [Variovorax paradoxus]
MLAGAIAISLAIGYFAGREHLKYEMRTAFSDAADGVRHALTSREAPPAKTKKLTGQEASIAIALKRKGFYEGEYGRNAITFSVDFTNQTGKPVRAFDGVLQFTDLLGNEIYSAKLAINDPIAAGATYAWDGKLDYNQFIADHERLRNASVENLKVVLRVKKVLSGDGCFAPFNRARR